MNKSVETSFKTFDLCLTKLQSKYNYFPENFVKATIQILYGVGLFDKKGKKTKSCTISDENWKEKPEKTLKNDPIFFWKWLKKFEKSSNIKYRKEEVLNEIFHQRQ